VFAVLAVLLRFRGLMSDRSRSNLPSENIIDKERIFMIPETKLKKRKLQDYDHLLGVLKNGKTCIINVLLDKSLAVSIKIQLHRLYINVRKDKFGVLGGNRRQDKCSRIDVLLLVNEMKQTCVVKVSHVHKL
jgi:hypothetical protein